MKLTVLGKYGPFPQAGGACSGYLIETEQTKVVLDLGSGTLSNLIKLYPTLPIDAVFLSHLHSDHCSDMLVLRYALRQLHSRGVPVPMPLSVVAPAEPSIVHGQLATSGVYDITTAKDGLKFNFTDMSITLHQMTHTVDSFCMVIRSAGKKFVYTGDTGYNDRLSHICSGADVLLADTCFLSADKTTENAPHMTAAEAAKLARNAGVGRLFCTHIWGGGYTDEQIVAEARRFFRNSFAIKEMGVYII